MFARKEGVSPPPARVSLDDFVAVSLEQIVVGIRRAQQAVGEHGARINPQKDSSMKLDKRTGTDVQEIEFDIAVTVTESKSSGAKLGVAVLPVVAGIRGGSDREHASVSRIRFSVPVVLPWQRYVEEKEEGYVAPVR